MTEQHKAPTWDHWAELTARVEALEATQHAHADISHLSGEEREQFYRELTQQPATVTPVYGAYNEAGELQGVVPASAFPSPASSLVERVAAARARAGIDQEDRAVIREVAAWLQVESEGHFGSGLHWAQRLRQEADR